MIRRLAALILLSTMSQTIDIPHKIPLTVAELGGNVTLKCKLSGDEAGLFYWYKLTFGYMVQTVAGGSLYKLELQGQFNNSRFNFTKVDKMCYLNITNVRKEDEATYFCQSGAAYQMMLLNGTFLAVNDHKNIQKSVIVKQSPETASVQPGSSVTLQCSLLSKSKEKQCPGEHSVYWFRAGSGEFHPGVIYTQSTSSDEVEEKGCVYSLYKTIQNSSDTGTYYCAVATGGEILFGEGTIVETRCFLQELLNPLVIVLGTLLGCCVIVIVVLIISRNQEQVCELYKGEGSAPNHSEHRRSDEDQQNDVDGALPLNYVALNFPARQAGRRMNKRELPQDSIYAAMRDYE